MYKDLSAPLYNNITNC